MASESDDPDPARIRIIDEDDDHLIVVMRIEKTTITANLNFIHALSELGHLLVPEPS